MKQVRLRFAPSPTGALHIGGIRTALYNYLLARQLGGVFILRIEDTDQTRYVPGAEDYIIRSLNWLGLIPDEGPGFGGEYGPYRQSERKAIYMDYAKQLVERGFAYYAFDTAEEIEAMKQRLAKQESDVVKYDYNTRAEMKNSLSLSPDEVQNLFHQGIAYVIRLKVPAGETVEIHDTVRGHVSFATQELDDKVLIKSDGMPTYHMANVIDDRLMKITHVIRGEEWLSSTAHHVLLYRYFGWENEMPEFSHLPLILKPEGNGKLSKRDGAQFGFPVFPISWQMENGEYIHGFREEGFMPEALLNFLAFLGWNPGTEQEIFSLPELINEFKKENIVKAGARFDYDKAKWFNSHYIQHATTDQLKPYIRSSTEKDLINLTDEQITSICSLYQTRSTYVKDLWSQSKYLFTDQIQYNEDFMNKKWKPEHIPAYVELEGEIQMLDDFTAQSLEQVLKNFMQKNKLKPGEVLPSLRVMMSGTPMGPDIYAMMMACGKELLVNRIQRFLAKANS